MRPPTLEVDSRRPVEAHMPAFVAAVKLHEPAQEDLSGSRERYQALADDLARFRIQVRNTFPLGGAEHLFVLEAPHSPARQLHRALKRTWPHPGRPGPSV